MDIRMVASRYAPPRCSVNRFFRRMGQFLYYDCFELLVIAIGVAVILLIWELTFWH